LHRKIGKIVVSKKRLPLETLNIYAINTVYIYFILLHREFDW